MIAGLSDVLGTGMTCDGRALSATRSDAKVKGPRDGWSAKGGGRQGSHAGAWIGPSMHVVPFAADRSSGRPIEGHEDEGVFFVGLW